jgi:DNA polymerase-3 subunit alpha (Gram-positive type)
MKKINEIFSDYEVIGNINTAMVEAVVLSKRTKALEMKIISDKYIEIGEFEGLNKFIRKRFALKDSKIVVKYTEGTDKKPIKEELKNIVLLLSSKYPALKAVLNNCEYEVAESAINFNFKIAASSFLKSMDYDKKIHEAIKSLYGTSYKINFVDKVSNEEIMRMQEETFAKELLIAQKEIKAAPSSNTLKPIRNL